MSSLYLHIPFCSRKCPYCDFYSQVGDARQLDEYTDLLCQHLRLLQNQNPETDELETVFFGGGTPSLLNADQVQRILSQLHDSFGCAANVEISLEANPGTLDARKLDDYREAGVNRLSIGVQSLRDDQLELLGRIHSAEQARSAVGMARAAGFDNVSLDLMFNLPGQDCHSLTQELEGLLALQPEHLSLYGLSFEEGTEFAARQQAGELQAVDDEESAAQYMMLHGELKAAGFEHYEISNFARPGRRCQHNQVYWKRGACLAAGCGAHSYYDNGWGERRLVPPGLEQYRQRLADGQDPSEQLEIFDRQSAMAETLYLGLRTSDGIDRQAFFTLFGVYPEEAYPEAFSQLEGRLLRHGEHWSFSPESWLLYDHLISHFL